MIPLAKNPAVNLPFPIVTGVASFISRNGMHIRMAGNECAPVLYKGGVTSIIRKRPKEAQAVILGVPLNRPLERPDLRGLDHIRA